jgi:hypothetical protein
MNNLPLSRAPQYRSYLIRCWDTAPPAAGGELPVQRFVVETVSDTPERRGFDSLAGLLAFLQAELNHPHPREEI